MTKPEKYECRGIWNVLTLITVIILTTLMGGCSGSDDTFGPSLFCEPNPCTAEQLCNESTDQCDTLVGLEFSTAHWAEKPEGSFECNYTGTITGPGMNETFFGDPWDGSHVIPFTGSNSTAETRYAWELQEGQIYQVQIDYNRLRPDPNQNCTIRFQRSLDGVQEGEWYCNIPAGSYQTCTLNIAVQP